jgi:hypothetical protein
MRRLGKPRVHSLRKHRPHTTRNALSALKYVVLKFSRARKRYERQGILASPEILDQARRECEADEAARESKRQASTARRKKQETTHFAAFAARIEETTLRWLDR